MNRKIKIINDLHLGATRSAGATKESNTALTEWQFTQFARLLTPDHDLIINGDLFDKFSVDKAVEVECFEYLKTWLDENPDYKLYLVLGNHDDSRDDSRVSSFTALCFYLRCNYELQVEVVDTQTYLDPQGRFAIVPHRPNQELFEAELTAVVQAAPKFCFVHANLMSPFAVHADHSLNVNEVWLNQFRNANIHLVFAHEHHGREATGATVVGNQIPTSVSDCLDKSGTKRYAMLDDEQLTLHDCLNISDVFTEVDWQTDTLPDKQFIRVSGSANADQAAEVVSKLAAWRRESQAFVITNAVQIEQTASQVTQDVQSETFDVWQVLLDNLPDDLKDLAHKVKEYQND